MTNDEYAAALRNELAYVKAQPGDNNDRIGAIEDEIKRVDPPVERAVDEEPENTAGRASRRAKKN